MASFCPQPIKSSRGASHQRKISFVELTHRQQIHRLLRRHRRATLQTEASQQMPSSKPSLSSFKQSLPAKQPINRRTSHLLELKPHRYETEGQEGDLNHVSLYGLIKQMIETQKKETEALKNPFYRIYRKSNFKRKPIPHLKPPKQNPSNVSCELKDATSNQTTERKSILTPIIVKPIFRKGKQIIKHHPKVIREHKETPNKKTETEEKADQSAQLKTRSKSETLMYYQIKDYYEHKYGKFLILNSTCKETTTAELQEQSVTPFDQHTAHFQNANLE